MVNCREGAEGLINEERKFITFERIKREKKYNMARDYPKVIRYARKNFDVSITEGEYFELIENYSDLRARYLR